MGTSGRAYGERVAGPTAVEAGGRALAALAALPVTRLAGVGPKKADGLEELGITSVLDLLLHYPRRYVDRTNEARIADLTIGEEGMVLAVVRRAEARRTRNRRTMVQVDVSDGSGYLRCTFFNQPWRVKQLVPGTSAVFFGKLETYGGRKSMTNPVVDLVGDRTGRIVPVYPQSEKAALTTWELGGWVDEALRRAGAFADPVPATVLGEHGLVDRTTAMRGIHLPESLDEAKRARDRLVFDELLRTQVALVRRKRRLETTASGVGHVLGGPLEPCGVDPVTGFYRDGHCATGPEDLGSHTVCAVVSTEFLAMQRELGNDLSTPRPEYGFPGLRPGDRWCVVAVRWLQAYQAGAATGVVLAATNERALEIVPIEALRQHAVDVPDDLSALE